MTKKIPKKSAALITGGAKRIGREIALDLALQGYDIVISYNKSKAAAEKLATEIRKKFSVKCEIFCCDLSNFSAAKKLATFTKKTFPHWNLLINNASIFNKSQFLTAPESELHDNLNIHLISPLILSQEFAKHVCDWLKSDDGNASESGSPYLGGFERKENDLNGHFQRKGGRASAAMGVHNFNIINMVDKNITRIETSYFFYLISKKFLAELTKMLALQLAPQIRVNAIAPGFILNSINEENPLRESEALLKKIPLQRQGEVKNITQTINFLLQNHFITGQILFVDGGASLTTL